MHINHLCLQASPARKVKKRTKPGGHGEQRCGRGGRWRAFVRVASMGKKGRCNLGQLAVAYKAAKAADAAGGEAGAQYAIACEMASAAQDAARHARPSRPGGSFGLNGQQLLRARLRQSRRVVTCSGHVDSLDEQALQLGSQAEDKGWSLSELVARAGHLRKADAERKQRAERLDAEALAWYSEHVGEADKTLLNEVKVLPPGDLVPVPSPTATLFMWSPKVAADAAHGVSWLQANPKKSGSLGHLLSESWAHRHQTIMHNQCPPLKPHTPDAPGDGAADDDGRPPATRRTATSCSSVGFCICTEAGQEMLRFKNAFLKQMKGLCKVGSKAKSLLADGFLVCALSKQEVESVNDSFSDPIFYHIGFNLFNPYRFSVHLLEKVAGPEGDGDGRLYLKACALRTVLDPFNFSMGTLKFPIGFQIPIVETRWEGHHEFLAGDRTVHGGREGRGLLGLVQPVGMCLVQDRGHCSRHRPVHPQHRDCADSQRLGGLLAEAPVASSGKECCTWPSLVLVLLQGQSPTAVPVSPSTGF